MNFLCYNISYNLYNMGNCCQAEQQKNDVYIFNHGLSSPIANIHKQATIVSSLKRTSTIEKKGGSLLRNTTGVQINSNIVVEKKECSPFDFYTMERKLGDGSFGEVYKVKHKKLGVIRAMKKILRIKKSTESENEINNEIDLLKCIDHPNIVKIVEFFITDTAYFIITELCSGGELYDMIINKGSLDEIKAGYIMFQLFSAILNCHNKNIIHRDLKPENILIDREDNGYYQIKIIDFGTAKIFEKDKAEQKVIGSCYYIAPEVLSKNYNEKCDLWSCGVILYILLTGRPPFGGPNEDDIIKKIKRGIYDESYLCSNSDEVKDLIRNLLNMDPNERLSAEASLAHEWFEKIGTRDRILDLSANLIDDYLKKLINFKYQSKFQEAALTFLVHNNLHLPEVQEIYNVFNAIDGNCDGKINKTELFQTLKKFYNNKRSETQILIEVDTIFKNIDNDGNGSIEYEEFVRAVIGKEKLLSDDFIKHTFNFFDKDQSGEITIEELKHIFNNKISEEKIKKIIQDIDIDGNQEINYEEFKHMMIRIID